MIQKINYAVTRIFDVILYPFTFINDFWGILFLSILSSLLVLVVYKYFSSPSKIKETKNKIKANMLAIRLYKDFWRVIVSSFFKSLLYTFKYFGLNFGPLLLILPILVPVFAQMDIRYGMRPFHENEIFVIKAKFNGGMGEGDIRLLGNEHFKPVMNPVFVTYLDEVNWKMKVTGEGSARIQIKVGGRVFEKPFYPGDYKGALSNKKLARSSIQHFLYPAEPLLPESDRLEYIYIMHPGKLVSFAGTRIHWIIHYLVLMLIIVLGLRKKFGVEF